MIIPFLPDDINRSLHGGLPSLRILHRHGDGPVPRDKEDRAGGDLVGVPEGYPEVPADVFREDDVIGAPEAGPYDHRRKDASRRWYYVE